MAIRWIEKPDFIDATAKGKTYHYRAVGETSENAVRAYAIAATPAVVSTPHGTLFRRDVVTKQAAYDTFDVDVPYGPPQQLLQSGSWTWSFDTTGGTIHISNSKETIKGYRDGANFAPNDAASTIPFHDGAIGVDKDNVKGTDIIIPALKVTVTYKHPSGIVTIPWMKAIANITGMVNSAQFLTFDAGEVLFLGARGDDGTATEAACSYQFAMSANNTNLTVGAITGIEKKGWEVAWISYRDNDKTTPGDSKVHPTKDPQFVYVERVYDTVDLAATLGFGA